METNTVTQSDSEDEELPLEDRRPTLKDKMYNIFKIFGLIFFGYAFCYLNIPFWLLIASLAGFSFIEIKDNKRREKITSRYNNVAVKPINLEKLLKNSSPWLTYPDWERADWLNLIILQLWPSLSMFLIKTFRGPIQKNIQKKHESFTFNEIDFGKRPPKTDGVKVYNRRNTKKYIILDFDMIYDGDCDIQCEFSGAQIGRIKDFQMAAEIRVVLKPLLLKSPLVGGIQIFFLNTPEINFELEGVTGIPGLSFFMRQKIEEQIRKKLVFPNKIQKAFTKTIEAIELKTLEPEGVLRVHVFEARNLVKKDVTGKSDPYVVLEIGAQTFKTEVISRSLNPQWDFWCEFIVLDPAAQLFSFKLYDKDFNGDDFLGRGTVNIKEVINGKNDQWIKLQDVKHGDIHLRFNWLSLTSDYNKLDSSSTNAKWLQKKDLSSALLSVFVESAKDLPKNKSLRKPDPYFVLSLGKVQQKGKVRIHTSDPIWEQGFSLLVSNVNSDILTVTIMDKHTDEPLGKLHYDIAQLIEKKNLQISKEEFEIETEGHISKLVLSLQLRILTTEYIHCEDGDYDEEEDSIGLSNSVHSSESLSSQISLDEVSKTDEGSVLIPPSPEIVKKIISISEATRKPTLGEVELSLGYNDLGQILVVTVHQIRNLLQKSQDDIPDPYVKLKLIPHSFTKEQKTKVIIDNCNPVFEELFEFLVSKSDLSNVFLLLTIKTKKHYFNKNVIGQVKVNLRELAITPSRKWYEIVSKKME